MTLIKKTLFTLIINLLIIVSFFVFVNCFGKQEMWPVIVSGMFFATFLGIKISQISKEGRRNQPRYQRARY
ncbi:hypothetical protein [Cesiribacter sp. SM1]|uniref:hypothetical protein n=1 Tax=Cesiribacter sp. SM1 TaxID=2861196 RepID=UPI001CD5A5DA|nr:hypothetical protein [Cesiribacter sp. SM1]